LGARIFIPLDAELIYIPLHAGLIFMPRRRRFKVILIV
jgi:hypothetical protein